MIKISYSARTFLKKLLLKQRKNKHIRILVHNPGTINAQCEIIYVNEKDMNTEDIVFNNGSFDLCINKRLLPFLKNSKIDLIESDLKLTLILKAPYARRSILEKHHILQDAIALFLEKKINPNLSTHGGYVSLIEITKENIVILKFSGGCNGCAMANITLKNGIEKRLLQTFPSIIGVKDITEHTPGVHSYY